MTISTNAKCTAAEQQFQEVCMRYNEQLTKDRFREVTSFIFNFLDKAKIYPNLGFQISRWSVQTAVAVTMMAMGMKTTRS